MQEPALDTKTVLFYIHDPMCSWCWGFAPTARELHTRLEGELTIVRLLGGLAPDSDQPMPVEMRQYLEQTWRTIEQRIPGTRFNHDFWRVCEPRRSTWPACRAVIAARRQGESCDLSMTSAIQEAYYLNARNPSDDQTLVEIAVELGLDRLQFIRDLGDPATHEILLQEINQSRNMGVQGFPSLVLVSGDRGMSVPVDYGNADSIIQNIGTAVEKLKS